jgi:GT2 family glycosyltransferase
MAGAPVAADVTLTVLNYNGRELLPIVLDSIGRQTASGFCVRVLDDASTDSSVEYLAEEWPKVEVVRSQTNLGVTAAMARAIELASTPYVALLNNDLELDPNWLREMLSALEAHPEAGSADCKMLNFNDREKLDGAGDIVGRNGYPRRRGQLERDRGQYDTPGEVFSATGGAALYRRAAFERVGPFDVDLGAYYEDVDWGFRARLLGMTARYVPQAIAYHVGSATTGRDPGRYAELIVRNQVTVLVKNFPSPLLLRFFPRMVFFQVKWLAFDVRQGVARAHVRGLAAALRELPRTLAKRRAIQRSRTATARDLTRALS